jgi:hypothetical protein
MHHVRQLCRSTGNWLRTAANLRRAGSQSVATLGTVLSALLIGWSCLTPPAMAASAPPAAVSSAHR